jgi:hypothetical protein
MSISKRIYLLDLIKNKNGERILPPEIKNNIQHFAFQKPIVTIQRAWRRYSSCNPLFSYNKNTATGIIEDIIEKLYFVHTPVLRRASSMGTDEWCCPWKLGYAKLEGVRLSYFDIAKHLAESRRRAYKLKGFEQGQLPSYDLFFM